MKFILTDDDLVKDQYIFTVKSVLEGFDRHGIILLPGVDYGEPIPLRVFLVLPDEREVKASVVGLPMILPKGHKGPRPISLAKDIDINIIPEGTEVWSMCYPKNDIVY